jgi:hypothetical protein
MPTPTPCNPSRRSSPFSRFHPPSIMVTDTEQTQVSPESASRPADAAPRRQPSPDWPTAAPEPVGAREAAWPRHASESRHGADRGGVVAGGGAEGDDDAPSALLRPTCHVGAAPAYVRIQGRRLRLLRTASMSVTTCASSSSSSSSACAASRLPGTPGTQGSSGRVIHD